MSNLLTLDIKKCVLYSIYNYKMKEIKQGLYNTKFEM